MADAKLFLGYMTRQLLNQLVDGGDVSPQQEEAFYNGVREFYSTAAVYALKNLPLLI